VARYISGEQEFALERVVVRDTPGHLAAGQAPEDVGNEVKGAGPLPGDQALEQGGAVWFGEPGQLGAPRLIHHSERNMYARDLICRTFKVAELVVEEYVRLEHAKHLRLLYPAKEERVIYADAP
jgi:hypothetical protein